MDDKKPVSRYRNHKAYRKNKPRTDAPDPFGLPRIMDEPVNRTGLDATLLLNRVNWPLAPETEYLLGPNLEYTSTTNPLVYVDPAMSPTAGGSNREYYHGEDHIPEEVSQALTPQRHQKMPPGSYQSPHTWSASPGVTGSDNESFTDSFRHEPQTLELGPMSYPSPTTTTRSSSTGELDYSNKSLRHPSNTEESPVTGSIQCKAPRFHCKYPECVAKGVSFGRQCNYRRHSEKHTKPHLCYHKHCKRSKPGNGFSRPDNLRTHLKGKKHAGATCCSTDAPGAKLEEIKQLKKRLRELEGQVIGPQKP